MSACLRVSLCWVVDDVLVMADADVHGMTRACMQPCSSVPCRSCRAAATDAGPAHAAADEAAADGAADADLAASTANGPAAGDVADDAMEESAA